MGKDGVMGYSEKENEVRVDIFKPSGKWYTTISVEMADDNWSGDNCIFESFKEALSTRIKGSFKGFTAVCLKPYHEYEHPIMITIE